MNKKIRKLYRNVEWFNFAEKVKQRDDFKCTKCKRNINQVTLQVHHNLYKVGLLPWQYAMSDCITLCKGCHAREHDLIEPTRDWVLIEVNDL